MHLSQVGDSEDSGTNKKRKKMSKQERLANRKAKIKAERKQANQMFKPNVAKNSLFSAKV